MNDPETAVESSMSFDENNLQSITDERFRIPGVSKIILQPLTQKIVGCIVGEHVTSERPWKLVNKELIKDNIDLHDESSDFLPVKDQIKEYPDDEFLLGYVPDEISDVHEFYICTTISAKESVAAIVDRIVAEQNARLKNSVQKRVGVWKSLGSELEVEQLNEDQRSRPLYEIEVDTRYPRDDDTRQRFKNRNVDDVWDGYVEILPGRAVYTNVEKRRIDRAVQAAPNLVTEHAQTEPRYPTNVWTQYQYDFEPPVLKKDEQGRLEIADFLTEERIADVCHQIHYNSVVDMYYNEYENLTTQATETVTPQKMMYKEVLSFTDIIHCKDKLITCVAWHPLISGIVAIAYSDTAPCSRFSLRDTEDEVIKAVHNQNLVLIWSICDGLSPKLRLLSNREVLTMAFCPYDENLLIGGCSNGQVVIWDIKNRLQLVETQENLTTTQVKYRNTLHSMMDWFINVKDDAVVKPAAASSIQNSHSERIRSIEWLSPRIRFTRTGHIVLLKEGDEMMFQFVTCSEDGLILVWDMNAKPVGKEATKAAKIAKASKPKPPALTVDESKYKGLDKLLSPIYRIEVPSMSTTYLPILAMAAEPFPIKYVELNPVLDRPYNLNERIYFKAEIPYPTVVPNYEYAVGNIYGEFLVQTWDGFSFDTGAVFNKELAKIKFAGRYHDGPVVCVSQSPFIPYLYLTVGGKFLCFWAADQLETPVAQRVRPFRLTCGQWSYHKESIAYITREDGVLEIWDLINRSDVPTSLQNISGKVITGSYMHPTAIKQEILGVCDFNGSFRMFVVPQSHTQKVETDGNSLVTYIERKSSWKESFVVWQNHWTTKYKDRIALAKSKAEAEMVIKQEEMEIEKAKLDLEMRQMREEEAKRKLLENKAAPGQYTEWAKKNWEKQQEKRYHNLLIKKKRLDRNNLIKQQAPIKRIEKLAEIKRQKRDRRLGEQEQIFEHAVEILLPEKFKLEETPEISKYVGAGDTPQMKSVFLEDFKELESEALDHIKYNPFKYEFQWKNVVTEGEKRRQVMDICLAERCGHRKRTPKLEKVASRSSHISFSDVVVQKTSSNVSQRSNAS